MTESREEIEMALIREFSIGGQMNGASTPSVRAEVIRAGIYREGKYDALMPGSTLTYAQGYFDCYRRALERRKSERDQHQRPTAFISEGDHDDDTDEWDSDTTGAAGSADDEDDAVAEQAVRPDRDP